MVCWETFTRNHAVAPTPYGTGARAPTFTNTWARGRRQQKISEKETDQAAVGKLSRKRLIGSNCTCQSHSRATARNVTYSMGRASFENNPSVNSWCA